MSSARCVLIVGYGYLGKPVAARLLAAGMTVFATTRKPERTGDLEGRGVRPVIWDVLTPAGDLPETDAIVYCVGRDRSLAASPRELYVEGLRRTLARIACRPKLIYVSSTGVYGDRGGEWVSESDRPEPADPTGVACLEAEDLLSATARASGWDWNVLRLAGIYGPGRLIGVEALRRGDKVQGDPDAYLNLIHVEDAAAAVVAALERGREGETYLIADGRPARRRDFYEYSASLAGLDSPVFAPELARRSRGDRRIANAKMLSELGVVLRYPSYREGLLASFGSAGASDLSS